jgi:hypothetical protein
VYCFFAFREERLEFLVSFGAPQIHDRCQTHLLLNVPEVKASLRKRATTRPGKDPGHTVIMKCVAKTVSGATAEFECEPTDTLAEIKVWAKTQALPARLRDGCPVPVAGRCRPGCAGRW